MQLRTCRRSAIRGHHPIGRRWRVFVDLGGKEELGDDEVMNIRICKPDRTWNALDTTK
jgi:hypothetical protein